ncbi:hypothetical protein QF042_004466 [Pedobacter sp. W3I1]|nr:FkbM family methyltransferase [Pedobacter sp. W3I1]MDQ0640901.1 hypothetical protein [Pedobacter sp. W3I1]
MTQKIDFLKIDIEGAEYLVLKDIEDNLSNVENLFIEYHSSPDCKQTLSEILGILTKSGFRFYIKEAWDNLPIPFEHRLYKPFWDLQLNIFAFRK